MDATFKNEMTYLKGYLQGKGFTQSLLALNLARRMHEGQLRKTGEPYIIHPVRVCSYLNALKIDSDEILAVALLHDVIEDTDLSLSDLKKMGFSYTVERSVGLLTKKKNQTVASYYKEILEAVEFYPAAALVKLSDRCNNISTMAGAFSPAKIGEYIIETEKYIYDLCRATKDFCPQYADQVFVMKYNLESLIKAYKLFLDIVPVPVKA
jgi:GTP pyrophosphokinase